MSAAQENRRTPTPSIIDAIHSPALFAPWFKKRETWRAWFALLRAMFGLPMDETDLDIFRECTGRTEPPSEPVTESWLIIGRRGGKSLIMAVIAVFLAVFRDWSEHLVPGESAAVLVLAVDRKQARIIFKYARAMFRHVPTLKKLLVSDKDEILELSNGINIEIATASFRSTRGYTLVAVLCDEIAFWRTEENSANPDSEILDALRPGMATVPGAILIGASSPYAKRGELYRAFRDHFGKNDSPVLVWKAPTQRMNPAVPRAIIDRAYERDPISAAAEYGAEFRTDIESFISREAIDAVTISDRIELPPMSDARYLAFCDPSGGSADSMTMAVAHLENERGVLDCVREVRPPFSPDSVVAEFCALLKRYDLTEVMGDRYGGEWPAERFRAHDVTYVPSEKPKSDLYKELLPSLNAGNVELLDNRTLAAQLTFLERRTARGGRDSIDHPPGAHDDLANAAAGALWRVITTGGRSVWEKLGEDL